MGDLTCPSVDGLVPACYLLGEFCVPSSPRTLKISRCLGVVCFRIRKVSQKEDREATVICSGKPIVINVHDVIVGDVMHLEPSDIISPDGISIPGHNLKRDESSATGESDQMKKTPGEEVYRRIVGSGPTTRSTIRS